MADFLVADKAKTACVVNELSHAGPEELLFDSLHPDFPLGLESLLVLPKEVQEGPLSNLFKSLIEAFPHVVVEHGKLVHKKSKLLPDFDMPSQITRTNKALLHAMNHCTELVPLLESIFKSDKFGQIKLLRILAEHLHRRAKMEKEGVRLDECRRQLKQYIRANKSLAKRYDSLSPELKLWLKSYCDATAQNAVQKILRGSEQALAAIPTAKKAKNELRRDLAINLKDFFEEATGQSCSPGLGTFKSGESTNVVMRLVFATLKQVGEAPASYTALAALFRSVKN